MWVTCNVSDIQAQACLIVSSVIVAVVLVIQCFNVSVLSSMFSGCINCTFNILPEKELWKHYILEPRRL